MRRFVIMLGGLMFAALVYSYQYNLNHVLSFFMVYTCFWWLFWSPLPLCPNPTPAEQQRLEAFRRYIDTKVIVSYIITVLTWAFLGAPYAICTGSLLYVYVIRYIPLRT